MTNDKLSIAQLAHWCERFEIPRLDVVGVAKNGDLALYFWFEGSFSTLPGPLKMRPFGGGYLQATFETLAKILNQGEARDVKEALIDAFELERLLTNGGFHGDPATWKNRPPARLYIELDPNGIMARPINLRADDLFAAGDDVRTLAAARQKTPTIGNADDRETPEQRQKKRWEICINAGLSMPKDTYSHLPRGIGKIAKQIGLHRQSLADDLNAYRNRVFKR